MNKYNNGKIYKIIDNTNGNIYIGSTTNKLKYRLNNHIKYNECISKEIIKNNDYKIELIENYPCNNNNELRKREQYYIDNLKCININNSYLDHKEYIKNWIIKNENNFKNKKKEYYNNNKDKLNNRKKDLYNYKNSWGGDKRTNNNLLEIDLNIFI